MSLHYYLENWRTLLDFIFDIGEQDYLDDLIGLDEEDLGDTMLLMIDMIRGNIGEWLVYKFTS